MSFDGDTSVVGALLIHVHPRAGIMPNKPSTAAWADDGNGLTGDVAYLLGASRKGHNPEGIGELPLSVPIALVTVSPSGRSFFAISRGAIVQSQSDLAFDVMKDKILVDFRRNEFSPDAQQAPEGYSLDSSAQTNRQMRRLLRHIAHDTGISIGIVHGSTGYGRPAHSEYLIAPDSQ